nr:MAG TPA: hypothetical protein [Caudoviricetes sp.]
MVLLIIEYLLKNVHIMERKRENGFKKLSRFVFAAPLWQLIKIF